MRFSWCYKQLILSGTVVCNSYIMRNTQTHWRGLGLGLWPHLLLLYTERDPLPITRDLYNEAEGCYSIRWIRCPIWVEMKNLLEWINTLGIFVNVDKKCTQWSNNLFCGCWKCHESWSRSNLVWSDSVKNVILSNDNYSTITGTIFDNLIRSQISRIESVHHITKISIPYPDDCVHLT